MSRQVKKVNISGKEDKSNKVTSWSNTTTDTHYPSEKLVKDSLDNKEASSNKVSSWSSTTTDTNYPSEKLVKDSLDGKLDKLQTANKGKNVVVDSTSGEITFENKPTIPTKISDLTNDSDFIETSSTTGLIKNDGTIDTTSYSTQNVWYGTCSSSGSAQVKEVDVSNWSFNTGNLLFVKFTYANSYDGTSQLEIENVSKDVVTTGTTKTSRYHWRGGELVGFVYDGTNFTMLEEGIASTTYYGVTKLENSVTSTSTTTSATPNSVKTAYDLANGRENPSNKVSSWSQTTNNTRYPTEKLVKDSLNKKLDADSRIVTTFTPQDYQYTISNGSWTNGYEASLSASGQLALDLSDMLTLEDDYVDFIVRTGANSVSFGILYGNANEPIASFPSNSTRRIKVIFGNSLEYTISDENNNILNQVSVNYPVITFSSSSTTTLNFGEKQWYHYVPFIDRIYPIGSIYMSVNSVNPSLFIGGEWERIEDRFLLASGSTYSAGNTGGEATHTLTTNEMPLHEHGLSYPLWGWGVANYTEHIPVSMQGANGTTNNPMSTNRNNSECLTTWDSGGGQAHNNMPPYLAVYMWKRTA